MSESGVYVVRPGDTVRSVAGALGVPAMELCRVNGLRPGDQLKPGQKLKLPRLQKVEQTQNLWSSADKTPAQGFEPLRHMQTQMIQLPRFPKKPEVKPEPAAQPTTPSLDADDKAKATGIQARMAKKKRLLDKEPTAGPRAPTDKDGRLSHEAALQAKRLADRRNEQEESGLINPFGGIGAGTKTVALQIPKFDQIPPPDAPAARTPATGEPPAPPPPAATAGETPEATDPDDTDGSGRKDRKESTRLFARRRQKGPGTGNTETYKRAMLFEQQNAGRESTRILSLSDVAAALDRGDAFKHLDEGGAGAKGGSDQFRSLSSNRGAGSKEQSDSFKMAGHGASVGGGDRFSTGKKDAGDSDGDVFKKYRNAGAEPLKEAGAELAEDDADGDSATLRKDQIRIGDKRVALPASLMTQSVADSSRTDPIFASALEGAVEPGRTVKIELGPGLSGPEPAFRELEGMSLRVDRIEILRSKDSRYLTQLAWRGSSPAWPEISISEAYQLNPDNAGDLTRLFMLLSRPQPIEFLENLRVVRRELELGPLPKPVDACLAFGLTTPRAANGTKLLGQWMAELAPKAGGIRAWEDGRTDQLGVMEVAPIAAGLEPALAERAAGRSLATAGPSTVTGIWNVLIVKALKAGQAAFLDQLAGPFGDDERMLGIGWVHLGSGAPKIEIKLVLSETWSKRVKLAEPFVAPAGTRLEICWSAASPKWTQRPKAVEALWKTMQGSAAAEAPLADNFAASFFKQSTLTVQHHAASRKPFAEFARGLLSEMRVKGEAGGQSQGRPPAQLWSPL